MRYYEIAEGHRVGTSLTESTDRLPRYLYHATPMYRYDPGKAKEIGVFNVDKPISTHGLIPSKASHLYEDSIYLTDCDNIALAYADNGFGEDQAVDWAILRIDTAAIDIDHLRSDLHGEADNVYHDILALGFTEDDWWEDRIPWWATLETTGQCRYTKPIPAPSIELVGVRYNGTYQDGAINEVREAEDKPEIFYDEGEQAI
jgi:hypothetical protein